MEIDVRGLSCPLPLMRTKLALFERPKKLTVRVSSGTARTNIVNLLRDEGFEVRVDETSAEYCIQALR